MEDAGSKKLWAEAVANVERLNGCPRHLFEFDGHEVKFGAKATCKKCGGTLDMLQVRQYVLGYEAAGGNANDVLPGFRQDDDRADKRRYFGAQD